MEGRLARVRCSALFLVQSVASATGLGFFLKGIDGPGEGVAAGSGLPIGGGGNRPGAGCRTGDRGGAIDLKKMQRLVHRFAQGVDLLGEGVVFFQALTRIGPGAANEQMGDFAVFAHNGLKKRMGADLELHEFAHDFSKAVGTALLTG